MCWMRHSVDTTSRTRLATLTAALLAVALWAASTPTTVVARQDIVPEQASIDTTPIDIRPESISVGDRLVEQFGPTAGEQLDVVRARPWHDAGYDGSDVTIGVIDFFDVARFWDESEHGPKPVAGVSAACFSNGKSCVGEFFDGVDFGGEDHGIAVVETILDMAPDSTILIGQATTVADYQLLVDWFVARDVTIVSRSLGSRYDGPGDGRGALNDVVANAVSRGVLWVNSAGNNGRNKYYRHAVRLEGTRVAFGPAGSETFLRFVGCVALGGVRWANDWDLPAATRTDYDVFLWESPTGDPAAGSVVASSARNQRRGEVPIETIGGNRCPASGSSLYLEIRWRGGDIAGDVLEILDYGSGISSFTSAPGSAAVSVVDSNVPGVISVGAVDPVSSSTIARYSSRGPSNDGRVLPDLVAPANFSSTVNGRFAGSSAAAAVVAGAAAVLSEAHMAVSPTSMADLLRHLTIDLGPTGADNDYGTGELRLPDPPATPLAAATPSRFVSLETPTRFLDTRPESAVGPPDLTGTVRRGDIVDLPVAGVRNVPTDGVTAIAVNITVADADRPSYVQLFPTNSAAVGRYSNLNTDAPGQTRANFAIVPVGDDGRISLYSIADGHLIVDVLGWFESEPAATAAGRFIELPRPQRTLDTRRDAPLGPLSTGQVRAVPMPTGVTADEIAALVVTVTAADPSGPGWLQALPSDRLDVIGASSTVNTVPGETVANTAIVPVGGGGISVAARFGFGGSHVVVDVVGYITSWSADVSTSGRYVPVRPNRAFDSRSEGGPLSDRQTVIVDAASAAGVAVPDSATGVMWNMTIAGTTRAGYLRSWAPLATEPVTSSLNWSSSKQTRASSVISAVDEGHTKFRVEDGDQDRPGGVGDLIADVFGYFT